jgi:hypothetical protein
MFRLNDPMMLRVAIVLWILTAGIICYRGQSLIEPSLVLGLFIVTVLAWDKFSPGHGRFFRREKPPVD